MSSNIVVSKYNSKRYIWVDNLKLFACLLVVIGHLYMSMMAGGWIDKHNLLYCWSIQTIYTFHVPLFFVCSGFLYQISVSDKWGIKKHIESIKKKAIVLGVPYLTFSFITLLLKNIFSAEVNNPATPFLKTILIEPIAPYWYLYTLFLLFCLISPVVGQKKKELLIVKAILACLVKIIYVGWLIDKSLPDLVEKVMMNAVWFCMGMLITEYSFKKNKIFNIIAIVSIFLACVLSYFIYRSPNENIKIQFVFACIFVVTITYFFQSKEYHNINGLIEHSTKYFMPIYVLHTIVAAGTRVALLKIGISLGLIHFIVGFCVSIFIPVIIYIIAEKYWWLLFWFEPIKAIKQRK